MSVLNDSYQFTSGKFIEIVQGDLTQETLDAIVNAANSSLQHGGGVAAAIVRKGGYQIQEESNAWVRAHGLVQHSKPAQTYAGNLPCRYIIHAVGPIWGEGNEDAKLAAAINGSLSLADQLELTSLAFPAISTGIFGFPKDRAAHIFFNTIQSHFEEHPQSSLQLIRLTLYDNPTLQVFLTAFSEWKSGNEIDKV